MWRGVGGGLGGVGEGVLTQTHARPLARTGTQTQSRQLR